MTAKIIRWGVWSAFLLTAITWSLGALSLAQDANPIPTLVPPTPVPYTASGSEDLILTRSGVDRIVQTGRLRVGVLFNAPPFGELNVRGEISGFDAELARSIADVWGVELRLRQVTRHTGEEMLRNGQIELLIAEQVHRRELDTDFEFSQTYHLGGQLVMVTADSPIESLADLAGQRVGVVIGTSSEQAVADWSARTGRPVTVETFLTLDRLYGALRGGQVPAIVASQHLLIRVATEPSEIRILPEPIEQEPYAIAMPRQDVNLRNLVNKTLQYLQQRGRLEEISRVYFPDTIYDGFAVWQGLGDEPPNPADFTAEVRFPSQYTIARMQSEGVVRIAGIQGITLDDRNVTESQRRLEIFHRTLIDEISRRWGVAVQYIPATPQDALQLVATGQADIALGITPDWGWIDRVDFTGPYLLRGLRLMVKQNSNIFGFEELRGRRWIAIDRNDPTARPAIQREAQRVNAVVEIIETREQDFAQVILEDNNADVALADSITLLDYLERYPNDFQLTTRWYNQRFVAMAVPRNDIDFRLLVEYTLQELVRDGTLETLLTPVMPPGEIPRFDVWPGTGQFLGFPLVRR